MTRLPPRDPSEVTDEPAPPLRTPDQRYMIVNGRLWRVANPNLTAPEKAQLVGELMEARRAVRAALKARDRFAQRIARRSLHKVKLALGERGPRWWNDGAPDYNRRLVKNTPYAEWYHALRPRER